MAEVGLKNHHFSSKTATITVISSLFSAVDSESNSGSQSQGIRLKDRAVAELQKSREPETQQPCKPNVMSCQVVHCIVHHRFIGRHVQQCQ